MICYECGRLWIRGFSLLELPSVRTGHLSGIISKTPWRFSHAKWEIVDEWLRLTLVDGGSVKGWDYIQYLLLEDLTHLCRAEGRLGRGFEYQMPGATVPGIEPVDGT